MKKGSDDYPFNNTFQLLDAVVNVLFLTFLLFGVPCIFLEMSHSHIVVMLYSYIVVAATLCNVFCLLFTKPSTLCFFRIMLFTKPSKKEDDINTCRYIIQVGLVFLLVLAFRKTAEHHTSICIGTLCILWLIIEVFVHRAESLRAFIVRLCVVFLGITLLFASIYHVLFTLQPIDFHFASSLWNTREIDVIRNQRISLREAAEVGYAFRCLYAKPEIMFRMLSERMPIGGGNGTVYYVGPNVSARCYWSLAGGQGGVVEFKSLHLCINNKWIGVPTDLYVVLPENLLYPESVVECHEMFGRAVSISDSYTDRIEKSLGSVLMGNHDWQLPDFWYFSVVTMTTLGYGDVIPNGRLSRGIVMLQVLTGVFFIAYALYLLLPRRNIEI